MKSENFKFVLWKTSWKEDSTPRLYINISFSSLVLRNNDYYQRLTSQGHFNKFTFLSSKVAETEILRASQKDECLVDYFRDSTIHFKISNNFECLHMQPVCIFIKISILLSKTTNLGWGERVSFPIQWPNGNTLLHTTL